MHFDQLAFGQLAFGQLAFGQTCIWTNLHLDKLAFGQTCTWTNLHLDKLAFGQTCIFARMFARKCWTVAADDYIVMRVSASLGSHLLPLMECRESCAPISNSDRAKSIRIIMFLFPPHCSHSRVRPAVNYSPGPLGSIFFKNPNNLILFRIIVTNDNMTSCRPICRQCLIHSNIGPYIDFFLRNSFYHRHKYSG